MAALIDGDPAPYSGNVLPPPFRADCSNYFMMSVSYTRYLRNCPQVSDEL